MKRLKLYLETSVWNFCFADDAPEKKEITLRFFSRLSRWEFDIFISDIVFQEIEEADDDKKRLLLEIIEKFKPKKLIIDSEVMGLARRYITEGVLLPNNIDDAIHAAVATVSEMDALISWNLKHLANLTKMDMINGVNLKAGYHKRLELVTPMEVSDEEIR